MKIVSTKKFIPLFSFMLVLLITLGYSLLTTDLNIYGTSTINESRWNVYFDNIQIINDNSTTPSTATINTNKDTVDFSVTLDKPKDYYEFTVDIKNTGSIEAMIDLINKPNLSAEQQKYLYYIINYSDNSEIKVKDILLKETGKETIKVIVKYKDDIESEDLPSEIKNINLSFSIKYVQADNSAISRSAPSFETDSWENIINNVKNNNVENYNVGETKSINISGYGEKNVRLVNKSNPTECNNSSYSQTACGFVIQFVDDLYIGSMSNKTCPTCLSSNKGGWNSFVVNDEELISKFPSIISENIIDTQTITGHGLNDYNTKSQPNFNENTKLYLLSDKEIWGNSVVGSEIKDTATNNTRQLDYYNDLGVTSNNYEKIGQEVLMKKWLRTPVSDSQTNYYAIGNFGEPSSIDASESNAFAPAFRLG